MKQKLAIMAAVLIIAASFLLPEIGGLSALGMRTLGVVIAFILLLVTDALPLVITCWMILGLMPVLGVADGLGAAIAGFSQPVLFFILASFGISAAFINLPLSRRILVLMLKRFGKDMNSILLAFMLCILPITAFISSIPVAAIFFAIALRFLELFEDEAAKKAAGRKLMIAIPVTCLFGGLATPTGSAMNLLALDLLYRYAGQTISFIQWMSVVVPLVLLILPVAWFLFCKMYKQAEITPQMINTFISKLEVPPQMDIKEKKFLVALGIMITLWLLSSWVEQINIMVIALLGTCAMFLPGIEVLEWKKFIKNVNFDAFFLVGTVLSLGAIKTNNGVSDWIATMLPSSQMPLPVLIAFIGVLVFAVLVFMPVGPSVIVFLAVPLIALGQSMGVDPAIVMLALAFAAGNCYLLPLDTIPLITYGAGYYKMTDMPKSTLPLQIYIVGAMTLILWLAGAVIGIF